MNKVSIEMIEKMTEGMIERTTETDTKATEMTPGVEARTSAEKNRFHPSTIDETTEAKTVEIK